MISISKAVSELERFEDLRRTLAKYYTMAIHDVAQYAVDVEPRHASDFRAHLQTLEALAALAASEEEYQSIHGSFRGELRNYHEFAVEQVGRMRAELVAAAEALQSLTADVVTHSSELELKMKGEITQLEAVASCSSIDEMSKGIRKAVQGLEEICDQLARSNNLTIAQLQDELRALHQEMSQERRAMYIDATSGAWIRPKFDQRVERLLREGPSFSVLFVWAGLQRLESEYSKNVIEEVRKALVKRMETALQGDALVARWSEEMFAAVIEAEPSACRQICQEVGKHLAFTFSVQENGTALPISVEVRLALEERPAAGAEAGFYLKLGAVSGALADWPPIT